MECCWFGQDPARGGVSQGLEASVQRHEVSPRELAGLMARLAKGAKDLAVRVEFNDAIRTAVDHPNVLCRGRAERCRRD